MAPSVLVVCLGNICRSPMGEAVLKHVARDRGIEITVDSAGTGAYHVGEDPDERTIAACRRHEVPIDHRARQVMQKDYDDFDYILAADATNLDSLQWKAPKGSKAEVRLWGSYLDGKPIADPYYGGERGFEAVFRQCLDLSNAFLDAITNTDTTSSK